jgi:hypothetical protein
MLLKEGCDEAGKPTSISHAGIDALNHYQAYLRQSEDMSPVTVRDYLSDLRQFIARCEVSWRKGLDGEQPFAPTSVVTSTLTRYRSHLQTALRLVNAIGESEPTAIAKKC